MRLGAAVESLLKFEQELDRSNNFPDRQRQSERTFQVPDYYAALWVAASLSRTTASA